MNIPKRLFINLLAIVGAFSVAAQSLPNEFHFSPNGDRLIRGGLVSTGFFDETIIDTINLEFSQSNYWTQLENNFEDKIDIPATLTYKGDVYDSVGVRFRGQTSYMQVNGDKKSFNITLDYIIDGQDIDGYETLNLINGYDDPSFMREVVYFNMCRNHIPAPKGNFVTLFINGENWGLYSNIQQLDGEHVEEWYLDKESTRWRGERTTSGGGGPGGPNFGAGTSTLNYNGPDTTDYQEDYTLKKAYKPNPWEDLVRACDLLNNTPSANLVDSLSKVFDIDNALWYLAYEILFTDQDSYVNKGGMDYYIYFDEATDRLVPQIYDGNSSIDENKADQWNIFYKETNTDYAMQNKLFAVPELRQRYLAHVRTILSESFDPLVANAKVDEYKDLIDIHVQNDPKKIYNYTQFTNHIDEIKSFFSIRNAFIGNAPAVNIESPDIANVAFYSDGISPESIIVNANISGSYGINKAWLHFGTGIMGRFEKLEMFDDGNHNDGLAGDSIFGVTIPSQNYGTWVRFYIEAVSANTVGTRTYSPAGAEHDVYIYQTGISSLSNSDVVINELMASNTTVVADQDGEYDDWVELYNKSSVPVDLSGYFLSDNIMQLDKWEIPAGTTIDGNGYLIIWTDNDEEQTGLHSNFKLSADGEGVYLTTPTIELADQINFDQHGTDEAFARVPNGTGNFVWQEATFNGNNTLTSIENVISTSSELLIYPNPATDWIKIINPYNEQSRINIYSSLGNRVYQNQIENSITINTSMWKPGLYLIKLNNKTAKMVIDR